MISTHLRSTFVTALVAMALSAWLATSPARAQSDIALYQGADRSEKLLAGAKKEGTLTLYTSATTEDMTALTGAFHRKYGVRVQVWRASSENIIQRAVTEARGGRHDVDLLETDGVAMETAHREKLLQEVFSPFLDDLTAAAVPAHREWVGDRLQIFAAAYNTRLINKADLPRTFADLADPKWKGKLAIEAGDHDWFSAVIGHLGEETGVEMFRDIARRNGISLRKGHTLLANMVVSGEVPMALTTYLYKVLQLKREGAPIDWFVMPPEIARAQGVGLARKPPHPHAAMLFLDFLLSDGQEILGKRDFFPANVKLKPLPDGLAPTFLDPGKLLDENEKWEKLYREIAANQLR